jgi:hypothetical protein
MRMRMRIRGGEIGPEGVFFNPFQKLFINALVWKNFYEKGDF